MAQAGRRYVSALIDMAKEALLLFVFGALTIAALYYFAQSGPVRAMREALLSAHLVFQAYGDSVPQTSVHMRIIAFDEQYCAAKFDSNVQACQPKGPIDRGDLAEFVERAAIASPKAIVIDVEPFRIGKCDTQTRKLVRAILAASRVAPVILPRTSLWNGSVLLYGPTFFDECTGEFTPSELAEIEEGNGIFFGHALLSSTHFLGVVDSIRPWILADIPNSMYLSDVARPGQTRVRLPQIALIGALALRAQSGVELLSMLQASALETRWHTSIDPTKLPSPLKHCGVQEAPNCTLAVGSLTDPPGPMRLSFRFGNQSKMVETEKEHQRTLVFSRLSFSRFNDSAAKDLSTLNEMVFVAAATAEAYGDIHPSSVGRLPGGYILANAIFDFSDGKTIREVPRFSAMQEDLVGFAWFVASTAFLAICFTFVVSWTNLFPRQSPSQLLAWIWPISLILTASHETYAAWEKIHSDFSQGEFSYAVIGCVVGLVDLKAAVEMSLKSVGKRGEHIHQPEIEQKEQASTPPPQQEIPTG
ncbi:hypothetical protein MPL3365_30271 [Mesorhizobium plurifarium]|uniref:CHASE2 domain-containing protein n=1 Tax=Mesorhizobium plurifarium TaxID=69974 RepID=A0A090GEB1_MESPL|nr:hypothetical protein MPL3365_30271 [Mesorhizobium plurifarium]